MMADIGKMAAAQFVASKVGEKFSGGGGGNNRPIIIRERATARAVAAPAQNKSIMPYILLAGVGALIYFYFFKPKTPEQIAEEKRKESQGAIEATKEWVFGKEPKTNSNTTQNTAQIIPKDICTVINYDNSILSKNTIVYYNNNVYVFVVREPSFLLQFGYTLTQGGYYDVIEKYVYSFQKKCFLNLSGFESEQQKILRAEYAAAIKMKKVRSDFAEYYNQYKKIPFEETIKFTPNPQPTPTQINYIDNVGYMFTWSKYPVYFYKNMNGDGSMYRSYINEKNNWEQEFFNKKTGKYTKTASRAAPTNSRILMFKYFKKDGKTFYPNLKKWQ